MTKTTADLVRETVLIHYRDITEFAKALGVSRVTASRLLNDYSCMSIGMALRLERLGYGNARDWLIMQLDRDLEARRR